MIGLYSEDRGQFPTTVAEAVKQAAKTTFAAIWGKEPIHLAADRKDPPGAGIVGVISFAADLAWSFGLVLPEETAVVMAHRFAGFEIPFDSPDMGDAVGELANVVAGDISARLEAQHIRAQMSLPTVVRGRDVDLLLVSGLTTLRMGFAASPGSFWFKLATGKPGQMIARRTGR